MNMLRLLSIHLVERVDTLLIHQVKQKVVVLISIISFHLWQDTRKVYVGKSMLQIMAVGTIPKISKY